MYTRCMVKMPLKGEVGGRAFKSHGNYIVDHGKSRKNRGIVFLNFCGNPERYNGPACDICMLMASMYLHANGIDEQQFPRLAFAMHIYALSPKSSLAYTKYGSRERLSLSD